MAKPPQILDPSGRPFGDEDPESEEKLPLQVRTFLEGRIDAAINDIREGNRSDLKDLARDQINRWRLAAIISTIFTVSALVYVPLQVKTWLNKQVDTKLTEPLIKESADRVIATKMSAYVDDNLKPLREHAVSLETTLSSTRKDIEAKSAELERNQAELTKQLKISELAVAAKAGSRLAYNTLLKMAAGSESGNNLLNASLKEIELFFDADRNQLSYQVLVRAETMKDPGYSDDEAIAILHSSNDLVIAAVNTLSQLKAKASVKELCLLVEGTENLHVATRVTRALEEITGERFRPLEFEKVGKWWALNSSNPIYCGNYSGYLDVIKNMGASPISNAKLMEFLPQLSTTCESDPDSLHAHCLKAGFLLILDRVDEAAAVLAAVEKRKADYRWLIVWKAAAKIKAGETKEAVGLLNQVFTNSPDSMIENTIKHWLIFHPVLDSAELLLPSKKSKATAADSK